MTHKTEHSSIKTETQVAPKKKKYRLLKYTLGGLVIMLGSMTGGATWLLNTESGLHFAVFKLPQYAQINIAADTLSGSILGGFSAQNLRIQTPSSDLDFSNLHFAWQPRELLHAHLHINDLSVGDIHITNKPHPKEPSKPATLPETLDLPISINVDKLSVGQLTIDKQTDAYLKGAVASYTFDHKNHAIKLQSLTSHWSQSTGNLSLAAQSPFALNGHINSTGKLDDIAASNQIQLSGSLKDIALNVNLAGQGIELTADTKVHPFNQQFSEIIERVNVLGHGINPKAFLPTLPQANLVFNLAIKPESNNMLSGSLDLNNENALLADKNGIPVKKLTATFKMNDTAAVDIDNLTAQLLKDGQLSLSGGIYPAKKTLNLTAKLENIIAADAISSDIKGTLNGTIVAHGTFSQPIANWQLNTGRADTSGRLKWLADAQNRPTLYIEDGNIKPQNGGELTLSGSLQLFDTQKLSAQIKSTAFNPAKLYPNLPEGNVNGEIKVAGELTQTAFQTELAFKPSVLSGAPLSGNGKIAYDHNHLSQADLMVKLGNNVIHTKGALGKKGDTLNLDINAPQLGLFGFGLQGLLTAKGTITNTDNHFAALDAKLDGQIHSLAVANAVKVQHLDFAIQASPEPQRPLNISLKGKGINASGTIIDNVDTSLNGTLRQHTFKTIGNLKIDNKPLALNLAANGGLDEKNQWNGSINTLDVSGALQLHLQNAMRLNASAERVSMSAARWQALNGSLNLDSFIWDKKTGLITKGNANGLQLAQLHNFYTPPVEHDLVIAADWDLAYSNTPRGFLNIKQQAGDVVLPPRKQKLGLHNFVLNTKLDGRGIHNTVNATTELGKISGSYNIMQAFGGNIASAPVSGSLKLNIDDLNTSLKSFIPVGQIVKGNLVADVQIGGSVSAPKLNGSVNGNNLYYRNRQVGVILDNGSLKSRLNGQTWLIDALQFKRKNGTLTLSGSAGYANDTPDIHANLSFDRYPILDQPTRRLTLSGSSNVLYTEQGIALNGSLKTDEGRFGFQESSAPTLDDDVIIVGEKIPEPAKPMPFKLNLNFDLANNFYFSGEGLNVNLGGQLKLTSTNTSDVQAIGSVKIVRGRYKAYGQDLVVSKGVISFIGPLTKPNLNIRAERRASPVGAGVEVLGNLDAPRVSLVANEPMSEKDKLSWLILNRASNGSSGDNAALATAASAFLAGHLNDKIGLVDDFGLTSQQTRNAQTGEMNPAQQVLTFGKQINKDVYLGYEAGLETASQTVKFVYQLSRSFQAIARLGTVSSGGELKYIKRFD